MEPTEKELLITYLTETIIPLQSSKLVGKSLKRFEILLPEKGEVYDDNKIKIILPLMKRELKELIYESYRDLLDIIEAYGKGIEITHMTFISKENHNGK
jgi:hypothetical protein